MSGSTSASVSASASVSVQSCWATDKLRGVSEKVKVSDLCQDLHPVEKSSESLTLYSSNGADLAPWQVRTPLAPWLRGPSF